MDQSVFLAVDQLGAVDLEFSLSVFPDLEPRVVYSEIFLINRTLQQPKTGFPTLGFSGDYLSRNNCVTLSMCACAYSRSELVEICYVFCFDVNLNLFS